jgi:hypothetical protein
MGRPSFLKSWQLAAGLRYKGFARMGELERSEPFQNHYSSRTLHLIVARSGQFAAKASYLPGSRRESTTHTATDPSGRGQFSRRSAWTCEN